MSIFNLEHIKQELEEAKISTKNDRKVKQTYLGSVIELYPSGKFYTPINNVNLEVCPNCRRAMDNIPCSEENPCINMRGVSGDTPYHCEFCEDMQWLYAASEELETIDAFLESGEGDVSDLYAVRVIETKQ